MQSADNVRVTYLITTRNRADCLGRTLANVREFIEPEDELIIIDGLSTDHTREVVEENRDIITVFVTEKDTGEAHAFNKGLFRARGRMIKPITDDDYFYPDAMRKVVAMMDAHPEVDAILCGGEMWLLEKDEPVFLKFNFLPQEVPSTPQALFDYAYSGLGLIMRRSILERIGGVGANYVSVDGDIICRLIESRCELRYLDVNLYKWYHRAHSNCNRQVEISNDHLLIAVRLGRWDRLFSYDPERLADLMRYRERSNGLGLLYVIWAASMLANTPLRPIVYLAGSMLRTIRLLLRAARRRFGSSPPSRSRGMPIEEHRWTVLLR